MGDSVLVDPNGRIYPIQVSGVLMISFSLCGIIRIFGLRELTQVGSG
jgi:hypothetical protein